MDLETTSREELASRLHAAFLQSGKTLALAESCTGGAIAAAITAIPNASQFFLGSIVAYSNGWKESFLGVPQAVLKKEGAVSLEAVKQMVTGLFQQTTTDYAAAVSGSLGPQGDGTVWISVGKRGEAPETERIHAPLDRLLGIDFAVKAVLASLLMRLTPERFDV